jgi:hypothetical protein
MAIIEPQARPPGRPRGRPARVAVGEDRSTESYRTIARTNLAASYWSTGRTTDAIPIQEAIVTDSERLLGPDYPDTITARRVLAKWTEPESAPPD